MSNISNSNDNNNFNFNNGNDISDKNKNNKTNNYSTAISHNNNSDVTKHNVSNYSNNNTYNNVNIDKNKNNNTNNYSTTISVMNKNKNSNICKINHKKRHFSILSYVPKFWSKKNRILLNDKKVSNINKNKIIFDKTDNNENNLENNSDKNISSRNESCNNVSRRNESCNNKDGINNSKELIIENVSTSDNSNQTKVVPKYHNWHKGETLYQQKEEVENVSYNSSSQVINKSFLNPMVPPIVKFTKRAVENGDSVYVLSRLRDYRIYNNVRLFLSFFHDQEDICYEGITKTNIKVLINQEGLPTNYQELSELYYQYHKSIGLSNNEVQKDLAAYRQHTYNKYREHLQKIRDSWQNYLIGRP